MAAGETIAERRLRAWVTCELVALGSARSGSAVVVGVARIHGGIGAAVAVGFIGSAFADGLLAVVDGEERRHLARVLAESARPSMRALG